MSFSIGCDLVYIPSFQKSVEKSGKEFLQRLFTSSELIHNDRIESLAGIFAVKESFVKALGHPLKSWHDVEVCKLGSGKPILHCLNEYGNFTSDVSIAHDGDYALAFVILYRIKEIEI